jgi:hypothetical protein
VLGNKDELALDELIICLIKDEEFLQIFNELKLKENIYSDFKSVDNSLKVKILIKSYFIVKFYNYSLNQDLEI